MMAGLVVAGSFLFTTIPTDGCNGRLDIVFHEVVDSGVARALPGPPVPPEEDECCPEWE